MTEAPERIWMDPDIKFPECEKQYMCDVEYIRKDVSDALVAVARDSAYAEIDKLQEQIRALTTSGIVEVAARNPSVMEYVRHWESRTEKAEARVAELESIVLDYRHVLNSAKTGRDLYCGMYVAKEYHFTRDQIDAALSKINAALKGKDDG